MVAAQQPERASVTAHGAVRSQDREMPGYGPEWFEALLRESSDMILVVDAGGIIRYANPATLRRFDVQMIGSHVFDYIHPADHDRMMDAFVAQKALPGSVRTEKCRFLARSGEVRTVEAIATNRIDDDLVKGIVLNGRDVTEQDDYVARLEVSLDAAVMAIATAGELRDPYTAGHQRQVSEIASAAATAIGLPAQEVKGISIAARLHDIGKIAVPNEILTQPGKLSATEFELIKTHVQAGHDIVAEIPFPWPVAQMILQHHERLDGSGYPHGLEEDAILIGSRILSVADVISAMSAHRPYRPALGLDAALHEITANRGRLYDATVVDACLHLFREKTLHH